MPPRILLVDDDRVLADVLGMALNGAGFEARVVYDGHRALEIVKEEAFDAIVLDIMMPGIDGLEVCRRIRSDARTARIPVMMLSALHLPMERREAIKSGADVFVTKPVVISTVIERLRDLLDEERRQDLRLVLAFVGAKGGVGTSTVALNTAVSLARDGRRVLLMELGGTGHTCAWTLGLDPTQTVLDLAASQRYPLDPPNLARYILNHRSGVDYLPILHEHEIAVPDGCGRILADTIRMSQESFEVIILDMGLAAMRTWGRVFDHSLSVVPVVSQDDISRRHLVALLEVIRAGSSMTKVIGVVVVQQVAVDDQDEIQTIAHDSGLSILDTIPPAPEAIHEANAIPEPLVTAFPDDPASAALVRLGKRLVGANESTDQE